MIHHNTNSNLASLFSGSCFWWYDGILSNNFCALFFKKLCSRLWAALVPTLNHLDHRISSFCIQGSFVNSEYCLSGSSVLFLHTMRMPMKAHVSFVLFFFFLLWLFRWPFLNQCFLQCGQLSWCFSLTPLGSCAENQLAVLNRSISPFKVS